MAAFDGTKVYRVPGTLVRAPSNLSTDYPYGGTELGATSTVMATIKVERLENVDAERGGLAEVIEGVVDIRLRAVMRQWDDDTLSAVFGSWVTTISGLDAVDYPGSLRPGRKLAGDAFKVLWVPKDRTNHPAIYIPAAIPLFAERLELPFSTFRELAVAVEFAGRRDATDRIATIRRIANLTL